jgi:molybdate transport system ATP-binding protein
VWCFSTNPFKPTAKTVLKRLEISMFIIEFTKKIGDFSLNVAIQENKDSIALFGPSGAGKSLTLQCIAGLIKPDAGRIKLLDDCFFDEENKINLPPQGRKVGYVFQNYALFPHLTVWDNIAFGMKHLGLKDEGDRIKSLMDKVKLTGLEKRKPHQLSGGQQQRVALARALAIEPKLLLLDEPFAALDTEVRMELQQEFKELMIKDQLPIILVTHNIEEAQLLSEQIIYIKNGQTK